MAQPSLWTQAQLQGRVFADLGQQDSADNDLLTAAQVQDALYLAEVQFFRDARALRRTATLSAVDNQREYALPEDCISVVEVTWDDDDDPLDMTDEATIAINDPGYLQEAAASPDYWYLSRPGYIAFYPPTDAPDGDETLSMPLYAIPYSIGGGVTSISRSSSTVTVTTNAAHNLRAGDSITISGSAVSTWNAAWTVATVPTTTTFTFANDAGDNTTNDCSCYYTGGCLPMIDSTDTPNLPLRYRLAVAFYATFWISRLQLRTDPVAREAGEMAYAAYADLVRQYLGETAI